MRCPCCQQELPAPKLLVDLGTRTIAYGDHSVRVQNKVARVAAALARRMPAFVRVGSIIEQVWDDDDEPDWSNKCLRIYIHKLRKALKQIGFMVELGDGYRLAKLDLAKYKPRDTSPKLNKQKADAIRATYRAGMASQGKLARSYGVTPPSIKRIIEGLAYPDRSEPKKCVQSGENSSTAKITNVQARAIRNDSRSASELAALFGATRSTIYKIRSYRTFKEV